MSTRNIVICHLSYKAKAFDKSFKGVKCVSITTASSNINEVIKTVLNSFIQKLHNHKKAQSAYKWIKIKKCS